MYIIFDSKDCNSANFKPNKTHQSIWIRIDMSGKVKEDRIYDRLLTLLTIIIIIIMIILTIIIINITMISRCNNSNKNRMKVLPADRPVTFITIISNQTS